MDLRLLEIFCCVYELMSFSRAAERLNITQPTVSAHIKTLEEHFGIPLFDRLGREIQPTRAAKILYEHSCSLSNVRRDIENAMNRFLKKQEGRLQLGCSTIPGEYILPRLIGNFHQQFPKIEVAIAIADTQEILNRTLEGEYELGFIGATPDNEQLESWLLSQDQLVLIAPNNFDASSITLAQLRELPFVVRERGSGTRQALEKVLHSQANSVESFNIIAEFGSTAAVKEAVLHGVGLTIISNLAIEQELRFNLLRTVTVEDLVLPQRQFYAIANRRRQRSPLCELLLEQIIHTN